MIAIDETSPVPIYQQVADAIRRNILSGVFKSDSQLPSIRELAQSLKVNPNTISKAYRELEIAEIIYFKRGQGAYVTPQPAEKLLSQSQEEIKRQMSELIELGLSLGLNKAVMKQIFEAMIEANGDRQHGMYKS